MKWRSRLIGMTIFLMLVISIYFIFIKDYRTERLMREGNVIIAKIENFKKERNHLPASLEEIGIKVIDVSHPPLYYDLVDSSHYTVSFGMSLGESKTYYSDSKKWEDYYREMR